MVSKLACLLVVLVGCGGVQDAEDGRDDTFASGKADGFVATDGDAAIILDVANTASASVLDDDVGLSSRTVRNIVAARANAPFATLDDLDAVPYVGPISLGKLLDYGTYSGSDACDVLNTHFDACTGDHAEGCFDIYADQIDACCVAGGDNSQLCVDIRDHLGL